MQKKLTHTISGHVLKIKVREKNEFQNKTSKRTKIYKESIEREEKIETKKLSNRTFDEAMERRVGAESKEQSERGRKETLEWEELVSFVPPLAISFMANDQSGVYQFPTHRLKQPVNGKQNLVLVGAGSFNPITYMHLRMFGSHSS